MSHFKCPKRMLGLVTLGLACMFATGWVRSLRGRDWIDSRQFTGTSRGLVFESDHSSFALLTVEEIVTPRPSTPTIVPPPVVVTNPDGSTSTSVYLAPSSIADAAREIVAAPYWSFVIPLTLLSAYLLLSKPRAKAK
ncbi:hypothetical protein [Schlesneria paludicola]|uniref:hypothetical protein n=1 Tax=Schlesneria paludicola TaxID=360056 RepID=UPI00029AA5E5|nr:hypothetical protein [Schlesneria paludicola]